MAEEKQKFLDKLEEEAIQLLNQFKKHPIKAVFTAIILLWGVKKIKELVR